MIKTPPRPPKPNRCMKRKPKSIKRKFGSDQVRSNTAECSADSSAKLKINLKRRKVMTKDIIVTSGKEEEPKEIPDYFDDPYEYRKSLQKKEINFFEDKFFLKEETDLEMVFTKEGEEKYNEIFPEDDSLCVTKMLDYLKKTYSNNWGTECCKYLQYKVIEATDDEAFKYTAKQINDYIGKKLYFADLMYYFNIENTKIYTEISKQYWKAWKQNKLSIDSFLFDLEYQTKERVYRSFKMDYDLYCEMPFDRFITATSDMYEDGTIDCECDMSIDSEYMCPFTKQIVTTTKQGKVRGMEIFFGDGDSQIVEVMPLITKLNYNSLKKKGKDWCIKNAHKKWCNNIKKDKINWKIFCFLEHFKCKVDGNCKNDWQEQIKPMLNKDAFGKYSTFTKMGKKWCQDNAHVKWCEIYFFVNHFQKEENWDKKIFSVLGGKKIKKQILLKGKFQKQWKLQKWDTIKPLSPECKFKIRQSHVYFSHFLNWYKKKTKNKTKTIICKHVTRKYKPYSGLVYAHSPWFRLPIENTKALNEKGKMIYDVYTSYEKEMQQINLYKPKVENCIRCLSNWKRKYLRFHSGLNTSTCKWSVTMREINNILGLCLKLGKKLKLIPGITELHLEYDHYGSIDYKIFYGKHNYSIIDYLERRLRRLCKDTFTSKGVCLNNMMKILQCMKINFTVDISQLSVENQKELHQILCNKQKKCTIEILLMDSKKKLCEATKLSHCLTKTMTCIKNVDNSLLNWKQEKNRENEDVRSRILANMKVGTTFQKKLEHTDVSGTKWMFGYCRSIPCHVQKENFKECGGKKIHFGLSLSDFCENFYPNKLFKNNISLAFTFENQKVVHIPCTVEENDCAIYAQYFFRELKNDLKKYYSHGRDRDFMDKKLRRSNEKCKIDYVQIKDTTGNLITRSKSVEELVNDFFRSFTVSY